MPWHQHHQVVQSPDFERLNAAVEKLSLASAELLGRAERAEATCAELQATLDYALSLVLCDEATRREALTELASVMAMGALTDLPSAAAGGHASARAAAWRPVVIAGGRV